MGPGLARRRASLALESHLEQRGELREEAHLYICIYVSMHICIDDKV